MLTITSCVSDKDYAQAQQITRQYVEWLDIDLSFQNFDREMEGFSETYGLPEGFYLLAMMSGEIAGGVGLRALESEDGSRVCEMKRLFVYETFKGSGIGRRLVEALLEKAGQLGYEKIRLDTLGKMASAHRLYASVGFYEIEAYRFNPEPGTTYLERLLP